MEGEDTEELYHLRKGGGDLIQKISNSRIRCRGGGGELGPLVFYEQKVKRENKR